MKTLVSSLALGAALLLSTVTAQAQSVADFYKDKKLTMIIGFGPGGGYDLWGRTLARHMGKHLPGNPLIIPQNMPGAGSLVAANHIYNIAPKDGTVLGIIARDAPLAPLTGAEGKFDALKFTWLGSPTEETNVCIAYKTSGMKTLADVQQKELIIGDTGPGTGTYTYPRVLNAILGTKFKVVGGFPASSDVFLAMERGEVSGICESLDSVTGKRPNWLKDGTVNILVQGGAEPSPSLPNVPFIFDLAKTEEQKQALNFVYSGQGIGRPFVAPPDMPADRVKALKDAFDATMKDPDFIADAQKQQLEVEPVPGDKLAKILKSIYDTPKPIVDRIGKILDETK